MTDRGAFKNKHQFKKKKEKERKKKKSNELKRNNCAWTDRGIQSETIRLIVPDGCRWQMKRWFTSSPFFPPPPPAYSPPSSPWRCALLNMQTASGCVQMAQLMASCPASSSGTFWSVTGWRRRPSPSRARPCRCRSPQEGRPSWMHLWTVVLLFIVIHGCLPTINFAIVKK